MNHQWIQQRSFVNHYYVHRQVNELIFQRLILQIRKSENENIQNLQSTLPFAFAG